MATEKKIIEVKAVGMEELIAKFNDLTNGLKDQQAQLKLLKKERDKDTQAITDGTIAIIKQKAEIQLVAREIKNEVLERNKRAKALDDEVANRQKQIEKEANLLMKQQVENRKAQAIIEKNSQAETLASERAEKRLAKETAALAAKTAKETGYLNQLRIAVDALEKEYYQLSEAEYKNATNKVVGTKGKQVLEDLTKQRAALQTAQAEYGKYSMNVGNYASATNMLAINLGQVMKEAPNFAISARIGIMSLTNNLPMLAEAIKAVKVQQADLNEQFKKGLIDKKPDSLFKMITASVFGLTGVMSLLMVAFQLWGDDLLKAVGGMFKAKDATNGLKEANEQLNKTLAEGKNFYTDNLESIERMEGLLILAKNGVIESDAVLKEYNDTLGTTYGAATDVNSALGKVIEFKGQYIQAVVEMEAAQNLLTISIQKSSEALAMSREGKPGFFDYIKQAGTIIASSFDVKNWGFTSFPDILQRFANLGFETNQKYFTDIQNLRNESMKGVQAYQQELDRIAKKYKDDPFILKLLGINTDKKTPTSGDDKGSFDYERKLREANARAIENEMVREIELVKSNAKTKQDEAKKALADGLITRKQYNTLFIALEEQKEREIADIQNKYQKKADEILEGLLKVKPKKIEEEKNLLVAAAKATARDLQRALDEELGIDDKAVQAIEERTRIKLQNEANFLADKLEINQYNIDEERKAKLDQLAFMEKEELKALYLTEEQKLAITDKYAKSRVDVENDAAQKKNDLLLRYAQQGLELANSVQQFTSALSERELNNYAKSIKGKANYDELYGKKKAELAKKNAIFERSIRSFETIISTASAIMGIWADLTIPAPMKLPMSIAAGATGAMQLGTIWATPLPEYEGGNGGGASNVTKTTVTEKFHTGGTAGSTANSVDKSQEVTATLLKGEQILTRQQTGVFNNILGNIKSMGGSSNITSGVGVNALNQADMIEMAMNRAFSKMPPPQVEWIQFKKFEDKMATFEQNRQL